MKSFTITPELTAVCEWKKTRSAFKHEATLLRNGTMIAFAKICYQNRTWERYEFESVLYDLLERASGGLSENEKKAFNDAILSGEKPSGLFNAVAFAAKVGDILCNDQKEKNDWKLRMMKAGLESSGLDIPSDWDTLSEDEKEKRLNGAIAQL